MGEGMELAWEVYAAEDLPDEEDERAAFAAGYREGLRVEQERIEKIKRVDYEAWSAARTYSEAEREANEAGDVSRETLMVTETERNEAVGLLTRLFAAVPAQIWNELPLELQRRVAALSSLSNDGGAGG